jgi:hypothetical protein
MKPISPSNICALLAKCPIERGLGYVELGRQRRES